MDQILKNDSTSMFQNVRYTLEMDALQTLLSGKPELQNKLQNLEEELNKLHKVSVAFSGGVDSALLLKIAFECLQDNCIALIGTSPSFPSHELEEAKKLAKEIGVIYEVIETSEMQSPDYIENSPERCFHCRIHSMDDLLRRSKELGFNTLVDGANLDDASDYRPGRKAANQLGVRSPLLEVGINKEEVRSLARALDLPVWNKPTSACLSSRIPYGTIITVEALKRINQAELLLKKLGFKNVRVRHYDELARIELDPEEFKHAIGKREEITNSLKEIGYTYVTLDLDGFRSGSMNLAILGN
jgi:uncharacterized protein